VPKSRLLDRVIPRLAERVEAHNRTAEPVWRLRLRVVMHAGEVLRDPKANVGQAVVAACRLLDSPELRARLTSDRSRRRVCSPPCRWPHPQVKIAGRSGKLPVPTKVDADLAPPRSSHGREAGSCCPIFIRQGGRRP
jgi:hypothetical protein